MIFSKKGFYQRDQRQTLDDGPARCPKKGGVSLLSQEKFALSKQLVNLEKHPLISLHFVFRHHTKSEEEIKEKFKKKNYNQGYEIQGIHGCPQNQDHYSDLL